MICIGLCAFTFLNIHILVLLVIIADTHKNFKEFSQNFNIKSKMLNTGKLAGKTLYITGASRGIGLDIAKKAARDGANIVVAAKTADPHPKLPGTIYTAAKEIEELGGKALPVVVDVRSEEAIQGRVATNIFRGF